MFEILSVRVRKYLFDLDSDALVEECLGLYKHLVIPIGYYMLDCGSAFS